MLDLATAVAILSLAINVARLVIDLRDRRARRRFARSRRGAGRRRLRQHRARARRRPRRWYRLLSLSPHCHSTVVTLDARPRSHCLSHTTSVGVVCDRQCDAQRQPGTGLVAGQPGPAVLASDLLTERPSARSYTTTAITAVLARLRGLAERPAWASGLFPRF